MKIVDLNSDIEPRFGTRKSKERIYWDYFHMLEENSRPLNWEKRMIIEERNSKIYY